MKYLFNSLFIFILVLTFQTKTVNAETVAKTDTVKVTIEGNDQMKYNLSEIKVKAGSVVVLTLNHVGKLPKVAMGHNWILLKSGTVVKDFAMAALSAKESDYIPKSDAIITYTKLLGGGESDTIIFKAPAKGSYDFICSFPGHYAMMSGKFIVE